MSELLATVQGSKGDEYSITKGDDGVIYCTCWAWKRKRTCKHLDNFMAGKVNAHRDIDINEAISIVVKTLKGE